MSAPLVLAVPVFNCERFVGDTLASLNANGDRLRWWLQDGASSDRTAEIARSFARPGDTVVSEPDAGQTDALNRALPRMGGDIIGFINGDDLLLPGTAARVLEFFAHNPATDLVYGQIEWIDEHGAVTGRHAGRLDSLEDALDIYGAWWSGRQWVQPEVFFRRSLWERVGGFDCRYHLAFDFDFWVRCFLAGAKVARMPATLTRFRVHAGQKSAAAERAADEIRAIVRRHLAAGPPISAISRRRIEAQIDYDEFQSGRSGSGEKRPFVTELLGHPEWLFSPHVRERVRTACTRIFHRHK